nr:MAG TPA: hypothetical protein [Caudoviricetes sp.]
MEFEQLILAALQTKFTGVDAKILGRIAKKYAKTATGTTEADAKTIVDGITFQQVLESHADYRATEAQKTAVANYESKHNLRDGKPIEQPQQNQSQTQPQQEQSGQTAGQQGGQQPEDKAPAWAQQIIADNKALRERLQSIESERTQNSRLERFREAIKGAPDKVKARYEKDFARLTFKDDADFDGYLEEIAPDIAAMAASDSRKGAAVGAPFGSQGSNTTASELVKARFEAAAKADAAPAIAGLPTTNP